MQVKSVSQLSSVIESGSFNDEFEKMTGKQTYIEVSINRNGQVFDSFKCNFTKFLSWINDNLTAAIGDFDKKLNDLSTALSNTIDDNFVHKTITGNEKYEWYAIHPEIIQGDKYFVNQLSGADGDFISLSGYNLSATNIKDTNLTATNLTATNLTATNLTAETNLTALNIKTTNLTATQYPADLTAKAALWS